MKLFQTHGQNRILNQKSESGRSIPSSVSSRIENFHATTIIYFTWKLLKKPDQFQIGPPGGRGRPGRPGMDGPIGAQGAPGHIIVIPVRNEYLSLFEFFALDIRHLFMMNMIHKPSCLLFME